MRPIQDPGRLLAEPAGMVCWEAVGGSPGMAGAWYTPSLCRVPWADDTLEAGSTRRQELRVPQLSSDGLRSTVPRAQPPALPGVAYRVRCLTLEDRSFPLGTGGGRMHVSVALANVWFSGS